jgi:hypothetical protein
VSSTKEEYLHMNIFQKIEFHIHKLEANRLSKNIISINPNIVPIIPHV